MPLSANNLTDLRDLLLEHLAAMDDTQPNRAIIFRTPESKVDIETKLWHFFLKMQAAYYHYERVMAISQSIRERMRQTPSDLTRRQYKASAVRFEMSVEDRSVLFEVHAFLVASRSALDFLAAVVSRYSRSVKFNGFRKAVKFLRDCADPVALLIKDAWAEWAEDLIDYRDHLIHTGALHPSQASHVKSWTCTSENDQLQNIISSLPTKNGEPIVFPVPKKPDTNRRLTRYDIGLRLNEEGLPYGLIKDEEQAKIEIDGRTVTKTVLKYQLAPGFVQASDLCNYFFEKLLRFSTAVLQSLVKRNFTHIRSCRAGADIETMNT